MDGQTLIDRVREATETELTRLASEKALLAATGARLEPAVVLGVAVETERALADQYREWADRAATPEEAEPFATAAETATENADRLAARREQSPQVDGLPVPESDDPIAAVAGGFVGQSLVVDGFLLQAINFFVNEADEGSADAVRAVRESVRSRQTTGATLLASLCETDAEYERAETAAREVIETAYEDYVDRLDAMGVDPKPVC